MIKNIRIPKERIPVLIGKNGKTKREIENLSKTNITVEEDIEIKGEGIGILKAWDIIKAIGRGFSPSKAKLLDNKRYTLKVIKIEGDRKDLKRIKGRLIGKEGITRKKIEELTRCYMCVYGKTVSLIGKFDNVEIASKGIEKLINGSPHKYVYSYLQKHIGDLFAKKR